MLNITESAAKKIKDMLDDQARAPSVWGLRIHVEGGGCSGFQYKMDFEEAPSEPIEGMNVFENGDSKVLIDSKSLLFVGGSTVDYNDGLTGAGFVITNPNATGTCGCGMSFSV
ncbi:MAG: iron-sulfur cluster assembly accessory protein [Planctomycetes bacterium]|nr:iron-sulfur cluster assembly accessory protein [Planctomycetota bacterium]